ncbi:MAG: ABC transporter permease subunit [Crenarchaeota archaeon]|nr:ABC transporter permease subunit [Thermoproteota archaeon]
MSRRRALDALAAIAMGAALALCLAPFLAVVASTVARGAEAIARVGLPSFLTSRPPAPGEGWGGIGPALAGTVVLTTLTTLIGLPVALATAILAVEFPRSIVARAVRALTKAMMEVPTVLVSMVVYTLVVVPMGTASALAGAIALAMVMTPYAATYIEMHLESVPPKYREAGFAIGMSRAGVALRVCAGIASRGIAVGIAMGIARALGETAPLLFTAGGSHYAYPTSILQPVDSLTLLIYDFATSPYPNLVQVAWGAALVLVATYLAMFAAIRVLVKEVRV